jgi:hypothetical protein
MRTITEQYIDEIFNPYHTLTDIKNSIKQDTSPLINIKLIVNSDALSRPGFDPIGLVLKDSLITNIIEHVTKKVNNFDFYNFEVACTIIDCKIIEENSEIRDVQDCLLHLQEILNK